MTKTVQPGVGMVFWKSTRVNEYKAWIAPGSAVVHRSAPRSDASPAKEAEAARQRAIKFNLQTARNIDPDRFAAGRIQSKIAKIEATSALQAAQRKARETARQISEKARIEGAERNRKSEDRINREINEAIAKLSKVYPELAKDSATIKRWENEAARILRASIPGPDAEPEAKPLTIEEAFRRAAVALTGRK